MRHPVFCRLAANIATLAIESSCDDTCISLVKNRVNAGFEYLEYKHTLASINRAFSGVFPFMLSNCHDIALKNALSQSIQAIKSGPIDSISCTFGPGIFQSLQRGTSLAKTLSIYEQIPLIPVHHMEGHIFSSSEMPINSMPFLSILISGGHTMIVFVEDMGKYSVMSSSLDDNIGEVYDKIAREIPVKIRGIQADGQVVDRLATEARKTLNPPHRKDYGASPDFSFSGIKYEIIQELRTNSGHEDSILRCISKFQSIVEEYISQKILQSIDILKRLELRPKFISVGGGVSNNSGLKRVFNDLAAGLGLSIYIPSPGFATDNAKMIGKVALIKMENGRTTGPNYPIPEFHLGFLKDDDDALENYSSKLN